jgi:hypothetical protein
MCFNYVVHLEDLPCVSFTSKAKLQDYFFDLLHTFCKEHSPVAGSC